MIENFWDTMYPELDDGDAEMRAAPLDWLGAHYLEVPLKRVPLTKSGLNFLDYHKAKKVGREADSQESYEKGEAFQAAVAAGRTDARRLGQSVQRDFERVLSDPDRGHRRAYCNSSKTSSPLRRRNSANSFRR